jgi:orotidine-5'-phosphate decarboxylase
MKFNNRLRTVITERDSLVCVGLDVNPDRIPQHLKMRPDPIFEFNRSIIEATRDLVAAYKPNLAFYEALGTEGWDILKRTVKAIPPDILIVGDAKRGDIGSTAERYACALLDIGFDAVTLSPYLGRDSIDPFIQEEEHGVFILCLTSNPSSQDFQKMEIEGRPLYLHVAEKIVEWNEKGNCGLVAGATHPDELTEIRRIAPDLPFLIPGIGAQGGDLAGAIMQGTDANGNSALVNSSRGIIYASSGEDFAESARTECMKLRDDINEIRKQKRASS